MPPQNIPVSVGLGVKAGVRLGEIVAVGVGEGEIIFVPRIKLPANFIPRKIKEIYTNSIIKLAINGNEILFPMVYL